LFLGSCGRERRKALTARCGKENSAYKNSSEISTANKNNTRLVLLLGRPSGLCKRAPPTGRAQQRPPLDTPQSASKNHYGWTRQPLSAPAVQAGDGGGKRNKRLASNYLL